MGNETQDRHREAVINQLVAVVSEDPDVTLQRIEDIMAGMHQGADKETQLVIQDVWGRVLQLHRSHGEAVTIAVTARQVAEEMQNQRDYIAGEWEAAATARDVAIQERDIAREKHGELKTALDDYDFSHPEVVGVLEDMENMAYENVMESSYVSHCPACDITDEGGIPVVHDVAEKFHWIITGAEWGPASEHLRQKIADFMIQIVQEHDAEENAGKSA